MATIKQLLIISETQLKRATSKPEHSSTSGRFDVEIRISQAASLLAIARSLNHIIDHGVSPGTLPMLEVDARSFEDK